MSKWSCLKNWFKWFSTLKWKWKTMGYQLDFCCCGWWEQKPKILSLRRVIFYSDMVCLSLYLPRYLRVKLFYIDKISTMFPSLFVAPLCSWLPFFLCAHLNSTIRKLSISIFYLSLVYFCGFTYYASELQSSLITWFYPSIA